MASREMGASHRDVRNLMLARVHSFVSWPARDIIVPLESSELEAM